MDTREQDLAELNAVLMALNNGLYTVTEEQLSAIVRTYIASRSLKQWTIKQFVGNDCVAMLVRSNDHVIRNP